MVLAEDAGVSRARQIRRCESLRAEDRIGVRGLEDVGEPLATLEAGEYAELPGLRGDDGGGRIVPVEVRPVLRGLRKDLLSQLRRGELVGLRWDDITIRTVGGETRGHITVRQQVVEVDGSGVVCPFCGGEHRGYRFGPPKTASGEARRVDLDANTVGVLLAQQLAQQTEREVWGDAYNEHGLVFAREDGSPVPPGDVTAAFYRLTDAAGLRRVRLHDLRHGQASLMLAAGISIAVVSKRLGHSSISITSDTYSHLLEGVGQHAAEAAADLVPRTKKAPPKVLRRPKATNLQPRG